ncbi:hypothetical protein BDZ97DRAFT_1667554, partial [Flammula alnicola]
DTHTQLVNMEEPQEDELQSHKNLHTPKRCRRMLDDESFIPDTTSDTQPNPPHKTPKRRKATLSSLASYAKKNAVCAAAIVYRVSTINAQPQCVVSGASDKMTVLEFSHVMSHSTPSEEVDQLEWSWNWKYHSLNVDTRQNLQPIRITLHCWFDMMKQSKPVGWFWLPLSISVLTNMHTAYVGDEAIPATAGKSANVQRDPETFYGKLKEVEYKLIPLPGMEGSWSVKHYTGNSLSPFQPEHVKYSKYPFKDLPAFELHVPYHFVIVNTGQKLLQLYGTAAINFNDCDDKQKSATEQTYYGGAGSDGGHQGKGGHFGGKDSRNEGQDATSSPSGTPMGQQCAAAESLAPWDLVSNLESFKLVDEGDGEHKDKPFVDNNLDEEYEDEEFFEGLKQWASDVWTATHLDRMSDSEVTLVRGAAGSALFKGVDVTTFPALLPLSVQ